MATRYCPECEAEYREGVTTCADCGVGLVEDLPEDDDEHEVVVYELADWTTDQRGELELRLNAEGIEHDWETPEGLDVEYQYETGQAWEVAADLIVGEQHEERVDEILDSIENPDELEAVDDDGETDEAIYEVMSDLYVASDRLKDDPSDVGLAGDFLEAAAAARDISAPYGIDDDVWNRVKSLAATAARAIESDADDDAVRAPAQELRDLLFQYV